VPEVLPPPRSLLGIEVIPPEQGGGLLVTCDCATSTQWVIEGLERLTEAQEIPFTCDGCYSTTWFTVSPPGEAAGA
jgi:hypothetical protein